MPLDVTATVGDISNRNWDIYKIQTLSRCHFNFLTRFRLDFSLACDKSQASSSSAHSHVISHQVRFVPYKNGPVLRFYKARKYV